MRNAKSQFDTWTGGGGGGWMVVCLEKCIVVGLIALSRLGVNGFVEEDEIELELGEQIKWNELKAH